jgi:hypothetical protein
VALYEGLEFVKGQPTNTDLDTYTLLCIGGIPEVEIEFLPSTETPASLEKRRRSLSPRVHAFAICQSGMKPWEKRSPIGVDGERSLPLRAFESSFGGSHGVPSFGDKVHPRWRQLVASSRLVAEIDPIF